MRFWSLVLGLLLFSGCGATGVGETHPVTVRLPQVELLTVRNQPAHLGSIIDGSVALISLWAPWCEACEKEFAALSRLSERARTRNAVVIGIAVGETTESIASFVERKRINYPQLVDEDFQFADAIGQRSVPTLLVVDRDGRIVFRGDSIEEALGVFRAELDRDEPPSGTRVSAVH